MNTYVKYCPNVFLAKCTEPHERGEIIPVTTRHGKENDSIVFNLIYERDGFYFYSIIRADGVNVQTHAKKKANKWQDSAERAQQKSNERWAAADEGKDFLSLGEPIKIGHHSERRHRALIERNRSRMDKAMELQKQAKDYRNKADYWASRENTINLSMPESIEYYEHKLEELRAIHTGMKNGTIARPHSFSLTYAKNYVREAEKNLEIAKKLWS